MSVTPGVACGFGTESGHRRSHHVDTGGRARGEHGTEPDAVFTASTQAAFNTTPTLSSAAQTAIKAAGRSCNSERGLAASRNSTFTRCSVVVPIEP